MAGWVGHVGWLIADALPKKWSHGRPAVSLAQDRESSPAMTGGLTTMLRHQLALWTTGLCSRIYREINGI